MPKPTPTEWLGRGLYSPREASRLLGVPARKLESWVVGRSWIHKGVVRELRPTVAGALAEHLDDRLTLTFTDLIELLFIRGFRETGLSLQHIRAAAEKAAELFGTSHPFTVRRFATDGRQIFSTLEVAGGDERMMELLKDQLVFAEVLDRYLTQLEYDLDTGTAIRWWPLGKQGLVRLDPHVSFGAPTVPSGVPTEVLFHSLQAYDGDADAVASWFEVHPADVRAAAAFEASIAAKRAA